MTEVNKESVEEVITEETVEKPVKVELTVQEKITKLEEEITKLNGYIDFNGMLETKQKGDTFVLNEVYCEVTKRTEVDNHLDIMVYELEGTEEEPEFGKFIRKQRITPETLEFGNKHASNKIFLLRSEIKKLESKLSDEKFVIIEELETED